MIGILNKLNNIFVDMWIDKKLFNICDNNWDNLVKLFVYIFVGVKNKFILIVFNKFVMIIMINFFISLV